MEGSREWARHSAWYVDLAVVTDDGDRPIGPGILVQGTLYAYQVKRSEVPLTLYRIGKPPIELMITSSEWGDRGPDGAYSCVWGDPPRRLRLSLSNWDPVEVPKPEPAEPTKVEPPERRRSRAKWTTPKSTGQAYEDNSHEPFWDER